MSVVDEESLSFELLLWLARREMGLVEVASWCRVGAPAFLKRLTNVPLFCVRKQVSALPAPVLRGRAPSKKRIALTAILPVRAKALAFAITHRLPAALRNSNRLGQGRILLNATD